MRTLLVHVRITDAPDEQTVLVYDHGNAIAVRDYEPGERDQAASQASREAFQKALAELPKELVPHG